MWWDFIYDRPWFISRAESRNLVSIQITWNEERPPSSLFPCLQQQFGFVWHTCAVLIWTVRMMLVTNSIRTQRLNTICWGQLEAILNMAGSSGNGGTEGPGNDILSQPMVSNATWGRLLNLSVSLYLKMSQRVKLIQKLADGLKEGKICIVPIKTCLQTYTFATCILVSFF